MKNICIIKTGSTFKTMQADLNDFEDWITDKLSTACSRIFTVHVEAGEELPDLSLCDGVIVTGSHSMVTDEEQWSKKTASWLADTVDRQIPLLAICYGHQLLAKAMGGVSGYHNDGMEIGTVEIQTTPHAHEDALFRDFPENFMGHTIHSQTVMTLPEGAVRLAFNGHDSNHAFRIGERAWGVQFHPEFDEVIMNAYIEEVAQEKSWSRERITALQKETRKTAEATALLKRFEALICE
ncbi:glutamine amidotransferase [uncultured Sulfuricurvum sp.]|uniref:glutamine amidotransferase n=1 Tax=uncultured Sulfuricurvum sp. TaxID=430693 RepID=UPI0026339865|nr:glutamine amidotransferase [uncultured Sulfuricurvum sp.]